MPKLASKEYCTGCTACAGICPKGCITMTGDENGFLFPVVDAARCIDCGLCEKRCPVLSPPEVPEAAPKAYAAYSRDTEMRMESSSGGVFTEAAQAVLEQGGAVFGTAYNEKYDVAHICVERAADLGRLRGAKYAQSNLGNTFAQVKARLEKGQQVLFSGTPCQVGGLKAFLPGEYDNLITVDFVCRSIPSPMAWGEYVKYRAERDNNGELPCAINLRSKHTGWTDYRYSNLFTYSDGHVSSAESGESLYMQLFVDGYISRESCENCPFKGYRRVSDLTIGDFWGIWNIAPEMDDNRGTSLVLVQSERGAALMRRIGDRLVLKPVLPEETGRQNEALLRATPPSARRAEALRLIRNGKIGACEKWFTPGKPTALQKIRAAAGSLRRRLMGK